MKGAKEIAENGAKDIHKPSSESFKNETIFGEKIHKPYGLHQMKTTPENSTMANMTHSDKSSNNRISLKLSENQLSNQHKTPEKPSKMGHISNHLKREPMNHQYCQKLGPQENNLNRFDVVVNIQPVYSKLQEKLRLNTRTSPSFHYVPMNPSSSILDLLLGLNSFVATDSNEIENELIFQEKFMSPSWNRRFAFGGVGNPY